MFVFKNNAFKSQVQNHPTPLFFIKSLFRSSPFFFWFGGGKAFIKCPWKRSFYRVKRSSFHKGTRKGDILWTINPFQKQYAKLRSIPLDCVRVRHPTTGVGGNPTMPGINLRISLGAKDVNVLRSHLPRLAFIKACQTMVAVEIMWSWDMPKSGRARLPYLDHCISAIAQCLPRTCGRARW